MKRYAVLGLIMVLTADPAFAKSPLCLRLISDAISAKFQRPQVMRTTPEINGRDLSESGFIRGNSVRSWTNGIFQKSSILISESERIKEPPYVALQSLKFFRSFPDHKLQTFNPHPREVYFSEYPVYDYLLTAKSLANIPPGRYSFVLLADENFLRLGSGHPMLGARRPVNSAGEIEIARDPTTGLNSVIGFNPRSDTYRPGAGSLISALQAVWHQNIFPTQIKIFSYDHRTPLLDLSVDTLP